MNIAVVGTSPSSRELAPYNDPEWEIWACGPANAGTLPRQDAWFELHDIKKLEVDCTWTPYLSWLTLQKNVYLLKDDARFKGVVYPKEDMDRKFGKFFWSSSLAYMMALAIDKAPKKIGIWGVDMSTDSEYGRQRPGCQHFIQVARDRGIEVVIPPESDLDRPDAPYGYRELDPMWIKLQCTVKDYEDRNAVLEQQRVAAEREQNAITGGLQILNRMGIWAS